MQPVPCRSNQTVPECWEQENCKYHPRKGCTELDGDEDQADLKRLWDERVQEEEEEELRRFPSLQQMKEEAEEASQKAMQPVPCRSNKTVPECWKQENCKYHSRKGCTELDEEEDQADLKRLWDERVQEEEEEEEEESEEEESEEEESEEEESEEEESEEEESEEEESEEEESEEEKDYTQEKDRCEKNKEKTGVSFNSQSYECNVPYQTSYCSTNNISAKECLKHMNCKKLSNTQCKNPETSCYLHKLYSKQRGRKKPKGKICIPNNYNPKL